MPTGTLKWFNVKNDEDGGDLFVHHGSVSDGGGYRTLEEGQRVRCATDVEPVARGG
jgi:CspA family cold shock protein